MTYHVIDSKGKMVLPPGQMFKQGKDILSGVEDRDYSNVVGDLNLKLTSLQKAFIQVQDIS